MSTPTDYSNTIIYKITCKDDSINGVYVGHTTNFVQRQHCHKQGCVNPKSTNYNCKLYQSIRDHGGWDNWTMEIIAFFKCANQYEARIKEQEYFTLLNANLNSVEPKPKEYVNKNSKHFFCERCHYKTSKKSNIDKHYTTEKHTKTHNNANETSCILKKYSCVNCPKQFNDRAGLWRHKKNCSPKDEATDEPTDKELILMLLKQNTQLIDQNSELIQKHFENSYDR